MANIEEKIEILINKNIADLGYTLYDVEYIKEGKDYFLRIYIDSEKGIDLNDCEKVSNVINDIIDKEDYIKEQYFLEVSSPGVERVVRKDKHLQLNLGKEVQVKLFKQINNQKLYKGILKSFDKEYITIGNDIKIDRKNVSQIKTVYNWN